MNKLTTFLASSAIAATAACNTTEVDLAEKPYGYGYTHPTSTLPEMVKSTGTRVADIMHPRYGLNDRRIAENMRLEGYKKIQDFIGEVDQLLSRNQDIHKEKYVTEFHHPATKMYICGCDDKVANVVTIEQDKTDGDDYIGKITLEVKTIPTKHQDAVTLSTRKLSFDANSANLASYDGKQGSGSMRELVDFYVGIAFLESNDYVQIESEVPPLKDLDYHKTYMPTMKVLTSKNDLHKMMSQMLEKHGIHSSQE